jgi:cell wall-associated NlpC family hydrolase
LLVHATVRGRDGLRALALGLPTAVLGQANQSWAQAEIKLVTGRGLLGGNAATFKPDAPLTRRALGPGGRRARAGAIDHAGIYLGNGWMINSSRWGVALAPVEDWNEERFAWGRRPLAEAGLAS